MQALWLAETYLERMEEAVARRDREAAANLRDTLAGILWELGRVPHLEDRVQPLQRRYAELCVRVDELYGKVLPSFLVRAQERCGATRSSARSAQGTGIASQSTAMAPQCQPMAEQQMAVRRDGDGAAAGVTEHCSERAPHVRGLADQSEGIAVPGAALAMIGPRRTRQSSHAVLAMSGVTHPGDGDAAQEPGSATAWSWDAQRSDVGTAQQHGREERGQNVVWRGSASHCSDAARERDAQRWQSSAGLGSALRWQDEAETWREGQASHREFAHGDGALRPSTAVPGAAPGLRRSSTHPSDGKAGVGRAQERGGSVAGVIGVTVHVPSPPLTTILRRLVQQQRERMVLSVMGVSNGARHHG